MKPQIYLLILIVFCFSCKNSGKIKSEDITIFEGKGISRFNIGLITKDSISEYFGNEYKLISHLEYSYEMKYPDLGLSFYYLNEDTLEKIFSIACDSTFQGNTSRGFNIRNMKMKDVIRIYGIPCWRYIDNTPEAHYDSLGIYFSTFSKEYPPEYINSYSLDDTFALQRLNRYYDSLYINEKVTEISIGIPGLPF